MLKNKEEKKNLLQCQCCKNLLTHNDQILTINSMFKNEVDENLFTTCLRCKEYFDLEIFTDEMVEVEILNLRLYLEREHDLNPWRGIALEPEDPDRSSCHNCHVCGELLYENKFIIEYAIQPQDIKPLGFSCGKCIDRLKDGIKSYVYYYTNHLRYHFDCEVQFCSEKRLERNKKEYQIIDDFWSSL